MLILQGALPPEMQVVQQQQEVSEEEEGRALFSKKHACLRPLTQRNGISSF